MGLRATAPDWLPSGPLVSLARVRLRRSFGARLGLVLLVCVALGLAFSLLDARGAADASSLVREGSRTMAWLGLGPMALAAANGRARRDRDEGIEALAAQRGQSPRALAVARALAATLTGALRLALPIVVLALFAVLVGAAGALAMARSAAVLVLVSLGAGAALGGLAAACGQWGGRRGMTLLVAVVVLPWALGDALGRPTWSVPGAVDVLLTVSTGGRAG